jgi:hypothetical protein
VGLPPWAKLALTMIGTTITTITALFLWASSTFVSRVEYANHTAQNAIDMERLAQTQKSYAIAESVTAATLSDLKVDVAEVKKDVSWIRQFVGEAAVEATEQRRQLHPGRKP